MNRPLTHADAAVILSGAATYHERTRYAAALFHQGRFARVILTNDNLQSGWSSPEQRNPYYYERALKELLQLGVPRDHIEVLNQVVTSTYDEAVLMRQYCDSHGIRSLLIITSSYHSRRALSTFQHQFQDRNVEVGIEPVPTGIETPGPLTWWLHPRGWTMVPMEYLKMIYSRFTLE